jgi:hypothetical protein
MDDLISDVEFLFRAIQKQRSPQCNGHAIGEQRKYDQRAIIQPISGPEDRIYFLTSPACPAAKAGEGLAVHQHGVAATLLPRDDGAVHPL